MNRLFWVSASIALAALLAILGSLIALVVIR
jgi:hypothetical protein